VLPDIQMTIDTVDPAPLVRFWSAALGYSIEDPPSGFPTWRQYWLSIGVPEDELGDDDCSDFIVDPGGTRPRIWFQKVTERKSGKNRLHLDLGVSGGRSVPLPVRRQRVDAEVERLTALGAAVFRVLAEPGMDHYGVVMQDPEGNEFCVH
jgi:hypothetical protein